MTILIVGGPSGSGKSTIGAHVAQLCSLPFLEGDGLHPAANVDKMSRGIPLQDEDRWPWLETVRERATQLADDAGGCIVTCSALKQAYRKVLQGDRSDVYFAFLHVDESELLRRMETRSGHFMKKDMLASQLRDFQTPGPEESHCIVIDASRTIVETQEAVLHVFRSLR
jgi:gluconokinase